MTTFPRTRAIHHLRALALLSLLALSLSPQESLGAKVKGDNAYKVGDKIVLTAHDLTSVNVQLDWDINGTGDVDWDMNPISVLDPKSTKEKPLPDVLVQGGKCCVWARAGSYTVTLVSVDFEAKKIQRTRFKFTVVDPTPPPPPPPPPQPNATIPDLTGKTYAQAKAALTAAGFAIAPASGADTASVMSQTPVPGSQAAKGSVVTVTLGEPPSPSPIPVDGLRVLIVYDESKRGDLPAAQGLILTSARLREYFQANCVKSGDKEEARIWATDTDTTNESKVWQDAFNRPRKSAPWILISNGKTGYEGPLPATVDDTIALIDKYKK